jgi:uncharacterized protein
MHSFQCGRCGNCCRPKGDVRLVEHETERIASYLGLTVRDFTRVYSRLTADRNGLSLNEYDDGTRVFLSEQGACAIQEVKPGQCRDFPEKWNYPGFEHICNGQWEGDPQREME